jgi:hypothetical protein
VPTEIRQVRRRGHLGSQKKTRTHTRLNYVVSMAFQPLPVSRDYLELCDRVGHSHRTIDARRRTNGDRRVSVRVTQAQYDDVVERAGNHGLTLAEYVRLVLGLYDVPDMPVD